MEMEKEFTIYRNERDGMGNCFLVSFRDFWFMVDPGSVNPTTDLGCKAINPQQLPDFWEVVKLEDVDSTPFVESTSLRTELVEIWEMMEDDFYPDDRDHWIEIAPEKEPTQEDIDQMFDYM